MVFVSFEKPCFKYLEDCRNLGSFKVIVYFFPLKMWPYFEIAPKVLVLTENMDSHGHIVSYNMSHYTFYEKSKGFTQLYGDSSTCIT